MVSGGTPHVGTQYEQLIQKLMETDGDPSELKLFFQVYFSNEAYFLCAKNFADNVLWKHPLLLHTKETLTTSLTTLPSETLVMEALKLFKVMCTVS